VLLLLCYDKRSFEKDILSFFVVVAVVVLLMTILLLVPSFFLFKISSRFKASNRTFRTAAGRRRSSGCCMCGTLANLAHDNPTTKVSILQAGGAEFVRASSCYGASLRILVGSTGSDSLLTTTPRPRFCCRGGCFRRLLAVLRYLYWVRLLSVVTPSTTFVMIAIVSTSHKVNHHERRRCRHNRINMNPSS
jgi:hypothetical protein